MLKQFKYILLLVLFVFAGQSLGAVARPDGTITTNNWSAVGAATLHEATDDPGPGPYDDTDYITSGKFNTIGEVSLSDVTDPSVSTGHIIRYAARLVSGGGNESIQIELLENSLPLSTAVSITESPISGSYTPVATYNLTAAQANAIGNYANLSFRVTSAGHRNGEESRVTMLEFEVPESYSAPTITISAPTNIGSISATFWADVTDDGSDPGGVTDRGTVWKTSSGVTATDNPASQGSGLGQFSHTRTLPANTIIYYAAYATNSIGTSLSSEGSLQTEPDTQEPTAFIDNAGASDMRVNWSDTHTGDGVIVLMHENGVVDSDPVDGMVYSDDSIWPNGEEIGTGNRVVYVGTAASNVTVTNLSPGSTYYAAVYAYGGSGPELAGINYIQASPATADQLIVGPPALTTVSSSNVTSTSADLEITVFSDGGGTVFQHGTMWLEGSPPTPTDHPTTLGTYGGSVPGTFPDSISGLTASTRVYFQGYGTNADGTTYSDVGSLYTEPSLSASGIDIPTGTNENMTFDWASGNGDGAIVVVRAGSAVNADPVDNNEYNADPVFGIGDDLGGGNFVVYSGSGNTTPVSNLIPGTTYHFAVFEYYGSGTTSGGRNYKITSPPTTSQPIVGAPQISTPSFADITNTTATLGAEVTNNGGGSIDARGTVWNTSGSPNLIDDPTRVTVNGQTQVSPYDDPVTGLTEGAKIYFRGYVTNSFGTTYTADETFFTEPSPATLNPFASVKYGSMIVNWNRGNGDGVIVIAREGSAVNAVPVDGTIYNNANVEFGNAGSEIGTANYVVYAGVGSAIEVILLSPTTTYHFAVYEYKGNGTGTSGINYEQDSPAIGSQETADPPVGHNYSGGIQCDQCHGLHDELFPTGDNQSLVCQDQCHVQDGAATDMQIDLAHRHNPGDTDCGGCHELHNGAGDQANLTTTDTHAGGVTQKNVALIRGNVTKYVSTAIEPALYQFDYAVDDSHLAFPDGDERSGDGYDGVCQACHTTSKYHRNDVIDGGAPDGIYSSDPAARTHPQERGDYSGQTCIACHPHDAGFAPVVVGGSCIDGGCHDTSHASSPPRREILSEFSLTSHHVSGGTVVQADCEVCHIDKPGTKHQNGVIDLRDPDTGLQIQNGGSDYSFANLTRDKVANGDALEEWVTVVQNEFCFKCHDDDTSRPGLGGAAYLGGLAMTPFSTSATVPEVYGKFDPTNNNHHAVRAPGNNPFCVPNNAGGTSGPYTTMELPWNQDATHDVISCFDCHSTNAHGDTAQRLLRLPVDFDTMLSEAGAGRGNYSTHLSGQVGDFCVICHSSYTYVTGAPEGTGLVAHPSDTGNHLSANDFSCMGCHAGVVDEGGLGTGNGAARGNIHGNSYIWSADSDSVGSATQEFIVGGWMNQWARTGVDARCGGCQHGSGRDYTQETP